MRDVRARSVKCAVCAVIFVKGTERAISSRSMVFLAAHGVIAIPLPGTRQHSRGELTAAIHRSDELAFHWRNSFGDFRRAAGRENRQLYRKRVRLNRFLLPSVSGGSPRWFRAPTGDCGPARFGAAIQRAHFPCPIPLELIRIPPLRAPGDNQSTYPARIPPREVAMSGGTLRWPCCLP